MCKALCHINLSHGPKKKFNRWKSVWLVGWMVHNMVHFYENCVSNCSYAVQKRYLSQNAITSRQLTFSMLTVSVSFEKFKIAHAVLRDQKKFE